MTDCFTGTTEEGTLSAHGCQRPAESIRTILGWALISSRASHLQGTLRVLWNGEDVGSEKPVLLSLIRGLDLPQPQPHKTPGSTPAAGRRFSVSLRTGFKNALQLSQWLAVPCVGHMFPPFSLSLSLSTLLPYSISLSFSLEEALFQEIQVRAQG